LDDATDPWGVKVERVEMYVLSKNLKGGPESKTVCVISGIFKMPPSILYDLYDVWHRSGAFCSLVCIFTNYTKQIDVTVTSLKQKLSKNGEVNR